MWIARDKDSGLCILFEDKPIRENNHWIPYRRDCDGFYVGEIGILPDNIFPNLKWEDEPKEVFLTSFDELVEKLCPPKHDGNTFGLEIEMLVAKMEYKEEHQFNSYEEEKQWMIDYLKEHWNN